MAEEELFVAGGYRFGSAKDAEKARLEQKQIEYFEQRLSGRSIQNVLSVYDRILDEKMFSTPVGWSYLCRLQNRLRENGISEEFIRPVPMYVTFVHGEDEEDRPVRQRIRPTQRTDKNLKRARISILINVFLAILVIAMFAIALNSDHPNILNYKTAVTNEYSAWEQELTERERAVREKEAELSEQQEMKEDQTE